MNLGTAQSVAEWLRGNTDFQDIEFAKLINSRGQPYQVSFRATDPGTGEPEVYYLPHFYAFTALVRGGLAGLLDWDNGKWKPGKVA